MSDLLIPKLRDDIETRLAELRPLELERSKLEAALAALGAPPKLRAAPASAPRVPRAVSNGARRRRPGRQPGMPTAKQRIMALIGAEGSADLSRVARMMEMYPSVARGHLDWLEDKGKLKRDERTGRYTHANEPVALPSAAAA